MKRVGIFFIRLMARGFAFVTRFTPFAQVSAFLSLVPFKFGERLRYEYYRCTLLSCGENVRFPFGTHLSYRNIRIGSNVDLGYYNMLGQVDIGDNVMFAAFCVFPSGNQQHGFDRTDIPIMQQPGLYQHLHIGSDVWIGAHTVVMADVADGCIVGAGSVVLHPIPPYSIAAGNPAKMVRSRAYPSHDLSSNAPVIEERFR